VPDPELTERPRRRRFTAEYKLRVLREAEACIQIGEQERDRLGAHRAAAIGVDREPVAGDLLLGQSLGGSRSARLAVSRCWTVQPTT